MKCPECGSLKYNGKLCPECSFDPKVFRVWKKLDNFEKELKRKGLL